MADLDRRTQLRQRLEAVQGQIERQCAESGRSADEVTLVVVTKTWPADDIRLLHDLGVRDIAENRHQEAEQKAAELAELGLTWHFIGQIQSNKAGKVASYADMVHSVDSARLALRLDLGAGRTERVVDCLVQINLDDAPGRGGVEPARLDEVAEAVDRAPGLRLRGVMGVAPLGGDASRAYRRLAELATELRSSRPHASLVSAGMSGDFTHAIEAGATHVRVGSAILGARAPLR